MLHVQDSTLWQFVANWQVAFDIVILLAMEMDRSMNKEAQTHTMVWDISIIQKLLSEMIYKNTSLYVYVNNKREQRVWQLVLLYHHAVVRLHSDSESFLDLCG